MEALAGCARWIIAVDDGDGPYGRQMGVDKVEKTNTVGAFPFPSRHPVWRVDSLCGRVLA